MKDKIFKEPCDCLGGRKYCSQIEVLDYKDGDCEVRITDFSDKKPKRNAIYLGKKSIQKLINYLEICIKKQITQTLFCLTECEMKLVTQSLKYVLHRLQYHKDCGAKYFADEKSVKKFLKESGRISFEEIDRKLDKILEV